MREVLPRLRRLAIIGNAGYPSIVLEMKEAQVAAGARMTGILGDLKKKKKDDDDRKGLRYVPGVGWVSPIIGFADPRIKEPKLIIRRELEDEDYVHDTPHWVQ
jgi:hypothetical protein